MDADAVARYLRRIAVARPAAADAAALRALQAAHLQAVPFENLSIHLGEPIRLDTPSLFDKIVARRRGGFCYELNGLFSELLRDLGFRVDLLSARVFGDGRPGPPFDHLVLGVTCAPGAGPDDATAWLADVGFGDHARHPIALTLDIDQPDPAGMFRVIAAPNAGAGVVDVLRNGEPQLRIEPQPRALEDFGPTCWWQQTSPESHFTRSLTCSRATPDGRVTLSGQRLIVTTPSGRTETKVPDSEALAAYREHFGLELPTVPAVRPSARPRADAHEQLSLALAAGRLGTWSWDVATGAVEWNARLEEIFGFEPGTFAGDFDAYVACLHPDDRTETLATVQSAVALGTGYLIEHRVIRPDGSVGWVEGRGDVIRDETGTVTGTIGCVADITERKAAEAAREDVLARLALLSDASVALAGARSLDEGIGALSARLVPELADASVVFVNADPPRLVISHAGRTADGQRTVRSMPPRRDRGVTGIGEALANSGTQILTSVPDLVLAAIADSDQSLAILRALELEEGVIVPLQSGPTVVGALGIALSAGRPSAVDLVELAEELGRRVAVAIERAVALEALHEIAGALQAGLAPPVPPSLPGIAVGAAYEAAGDRVEIGGDFYDFIQIPDERWLMVVGDVCGRGPEAAALNAQVRYATRALARTGLGLGELASVVNDNVVADAHDSRFCTAVFVALRELERDEHGRPVLEAEVVTAGHPRPVVIRAAGGVEAVTARGKALGVQDRQEYPSTVVALQPGDTVLMVTDGVLEARDRSRVFFEQGGWERLLPTLAGLSADAVAEAVVGAARRFAAGYLDDDLAVVAIQARGWDASEP